jgi:hypothetical protein
VHGVGAGCEGHVGAVVDGEQRTVAVGGLAKVLAPSHQIACLGVLLPELDHVDAGFQDGVEEFRKVPRFGSGPRHHV